MEVSTEQVDYLTGSNCSMPRLLIGTEDHGSKWNHQRQCCRFYEQGQLDPPDRMRALSKFTRT